MTLKAEVGQIAPIVGVIEQNIASLQSFRSF